MLEEKLKLLKKQLIEYATLVESMLDKCVKGLLKKESALLREVIDRDEPQANTFELELDDLSTTVIAQSEPKAKDLRSILMILKMNNDLERIGDHAVNIAESGLFLIERPPIKPVLDIPKMAEVTRTMLHDSIDSFVNEDVPRAREICERDSIVDDLGDQILGELITFMSTDKGSVERSLHLLRITSNLERVADLATNICEDVIFVVEGRVIKHHKDEEK
jgi:phosphate transport system protein